MPIGAIPNSATGTTGNGSSRSTAKYGLVRTRIDEPNGTSGSSTHNGNGRSNSREGGQDPTASPSLFTDFRTKVEKYLYASEEEERESRRRRGTEEELPLTGAGQRDLYGGGRSMPSSPVPTLPEAYHSVPIPRNRPGEAQTWWSRLRTLSAYIGPGYMVAVGYMDPGNWATDIAGGALFNFSLLFIVLLSSLLAIFLQVLTVKLGIATKRDLAQMCRERYSARFSMFLWITAEVAIAACDLAEVIGSAIALQLLFGLPLVWGCCLTALDVLLVLSFFDRPNRFRFLEMAVMVLVAIITFCFVGELALSQPSSMGVLQGLIVPDFSIIQDSTKLYIAMGILGATVMPHNLYLHSSIVQTRDIDDAPEMKAEAILYSSVDTIVALSLAMFVNAAILMVSAAAFFDPTGKVNGGEAPSVIEAYHLLAPILGLEMASILFGVALLASGQNSTLTGTLAGQIIMEGFVSVRLKPWIRRLVTRLLVVIPAVLTVVIAGQAGVDYLLVLSQVILSMQLSFAVFPLIQFTSDPSIMGSQFVNSRFTKYLGWFTAWLIALLNLWLLVLTAFGIGV